MGKDRSSKAYLTVVITSQNLVDLRDKATGFAETRIVVMRELVSKRLGADPARLGAWLSWTKRKRPTNISSLLQQSREMPRLAPVSNFPGFSSNISNHGVARARSALGRWISNAVPQRH